MKSAFTFCFVCFFCFVFFGVLNLGGADSTGTTTDPHSKVIVVREGNENLLAAPPKVFVESGTENLSGSPEEGLKPARRTWEQRCSEWKAELQRLNGKNLMVASCGTPTRTQESIQSEKWYTYQSKATYKIRVIGK